MRARVRPSTDGAPMKPRLRSRRTSDRLPRVPGISPVPSGSRKPPIVVPRPTAGTANVIVKTKYLPAGRAAGYADYMTRDTSDGKAASQVSTYMASHGSERPDGRAELFTRAGEVVSRERFVQASQSDPRVWTVIVSPAHGNALDLQTFARDFMRQVEQDTGRTVEWVGVVHKNTQTHHIHVLIRGRDQMGKVLNFAPTYIQRGMRYRAMNIQAQMLSRIRTVKPSVPTRGEVRTQLTRLEQQISGVTPLKTIQPPKSHHLSW